MPNKDFYFALGATSGAGLLWAWRRLRARRSGPARLGLAWLVAIPLVLAAGGLYALTPDVLHALHVLPKKTTRGPAFDVFFFHSSFERLENRDAVWDRRLNWAGELLLFALALGLVGVYIGEARRAWRELDDRRRARSHPPKVHL